MSLTKKNFEQFINCDFVDEYDYERECRRREYLSELWVQQRNLENSIKDGLGEDEEKLGEAPRNTEHGFHREEN